MRKRRQFSETGFYHVVIRGVNKQNIFYDDADRELFLELLKRYAGKYNVKIHAYCLMDNHVHLEIEDLNSNISLFMQSLCSLYARRFNKKYDRMGHLFQERYASEVILDDSYFLTVLRYILQNPEAAGISESCDYKWSSYYAYGEYFSFVRKKKVMSYFDNLKMLYDFLSHRENLQCLEIELRPSEREIDYINRIKKLLGTENPIIQPDLELSIIRHKVRKLKDSGFSIRTISRVTGICKYIVQHA